MISGAEPGRRAVLLGLLALTAQAAQPWGLEQLMASLAQTRQATASFTERETSPLLSGPIIATGTLTYVAPGYVRKQTSTPTPSIFTLQDGQITLTQSGATRTFALDEDPRIAGLIEAIRGTLAGDLPALQRFYTITLSGTAQNWQLVLLPGDAALARFIRSVTISGTGGKVTIIDTLSTDGAESRMSIAPDAP